MQLIPLQKLRPSPTNPRTDLGDLTELAASIKEVGVISPILARPHKSGFEIVFGHRRCKAAELAGLDSVPSEVQELSDDQVLEHQMVEVLQREGLSPLDEADSLNKLLEKHSIDYVAGRLGRSKSYVLRRARLTNLIPPARAQLITGEMLLGVALLLAEFEPEQQERAFKQLDLARPWERHGDTQGPISLNEARSVVEETILRALNDAPFDRGDATLVPAAGPCTTCPKRTGAQVELFADASSPDLCTDPKCFSAKLDAFWLIRKSEAKEKGQEILPKARAKELINEYGSTPTVRGSEFRSLDEKVFLPGTSKQKTVRSLFKDELPPITLARAERSGRPVELVKAKDVEAAIKQAAKAAGVKAEPEHRGPSAAEKKERERAKKLGQVRRGAIGAMVREIERSWPSASAMPFVGQVVNLLLQASIGSVWNEAGKAACDRRQLPDAQTVEQRLHAWMKKNTGAPERLAMAFELLIYRSAPSKNSPGVDGAWKEALAVFKIDTKNLEARDVDSKPDDADKSRVIAPRVKNKPASNSRPAKKRKTAKRPQARA